ncbi:class I SAM-dependent methyltransferase [Kluyvera ascorbata]|uniref:class I SAM-dependent methyltransferase n=1 Tax=Kluyvera ascorbata TaxID=51288 RepID=UPI0038611E27
MDVNKQYHCPLCNYKGSFMTFRGRQHALCPQCSSLERHRLQFVVLQNILSDKNTSEMKALHFAPEPAFRAWFSHLFYEYKTADIEMEGVDFKVDIQDLPLADRQFDFIFASHVLEHIPDDRKAISEIHRILKPGGIAILPVPIVCEKTIEYDAPDPEEDFHVRAPGMDYYDRYEACFSKWEYYSSNSLPDIYQPYVYGSSVKDHPLRVDTERLMDVVPVVYR